MAAEIRCYEMHGVRVAELPKTGEPLKSDRQAIDAISEASACQPELMAIPVERLGDDFFQLKTRIAGEVLQKFVTYRKRVAIVGDISVYLNESSALRDFVYECNAGREIWFLTSVAELDRKLLGEAERV
jgi:hypothetical protein